MTKRKPAKLAIPEFDAPTPVGSWHGEGSEPTGDTPRCTKCINERDFHGFANPGSYWHRNDGCWYNCGRCDDNGYYTPADADRHERYKARIDSGQPMGTSYRTYQH